MSHLMSQEFTSSETLTRNVMAIQDRFLFLPNRQGSL